MMALYDPRVELCFDKGSDPTAVSGWVWTDITKDVIGPVDYNAGRSDESSRATESSISFSVLNDDGKYTPGLANSPYYGKLDYGVPVRVTDAKLANNAYVAFADDFTSSNIKTADHSSLDITGDLDIRADIEPAAWRASVAQDGPVSMHVLGKYKTGPTPGTDDQRSYMLNITYLGNIELVWSSNNTDRHVVGSTTPVPIVNGRLAIRATLDVNNGAGGHTVTFYTASSIDGTWTQLGTQQVIGGTTSIYSGSAPLWFGMTSGPWIGEFDLLSQYLGKVYAFQVRNGIDGTIVANPDFRPLRGGTQFLTDSTGKLWEIGDQGVGGYLVDPSTRAWGYLSEINPEWPAGDVEEIGAGGHSVVSMKATGLFARFDRVGQPLDSAIKRSILKTITSPNAPPTAYWPCEDKEQSTYFGSAVVGVDQATSLPALFYTATPEATEFGNYSEFKSSLPVAHANNGAFYGPMPTYSDNGVCSMNVLIHVPEDEVGDLTTDIRLLQMNLSGSIGKVYVDIERTTGNLKVKAEYADGSSALSDIYYAFALKNSKFFFRLLVGQSGSNVAVIYSTKVFEGPGVSSEITNIIGSATMGRATAVMVNPLGSANKIDFGHVVVYTNTGAYDTFFPYTRTYYDGWTGEQAALRFARLCLEEKVPFHLRGGFAETEYMGAQGIETLPNLLQECADTDGAILYEARDTEAFVFRTRMNMNDQPPVVLDADSNTGGDIVNPFQPVRDDSLAANDVTANRTDGSSVRLTEDSDIAKRGTYKLDVTRNVASDFQLDDIAGELLWRGTDSGMRYPQVSPAPDVNPSIYTKLGAVQLGDKIRVNNLPSQHPNRFVDLLVQGYDESIIPHQLNTTLNTTDAGPWDPAEGGEPWNMDPDAPVRADAENSSLVTAVNSIDSTLSVRTLDAPPWITTADYPAEFPFDVEVGGEQMRVTANTDRVVDTFTRTSASSWGTADTGQVWTNIGGTASDYSVSSGTGRHVFPTASATWKRSFTDVVDQPDVYARIKAPVTATGTFYIGGVILAYQNTTTHYTAALLFDTTGAVVGAFAAPEGSIGSSWTTNMVYAPGDWFNIRARAWNGLLQMKAWKLGDLEPAYWQLTVQNTTFGYSGAIGFTSVRPVGNTNANLTLEFDNLHLSSHQTMTVTRAVNGVRKSQTAGSEVSLWTPAYLAR